MEKGNFPHFSLEIRMVGHACVGDNIRQSSDAHWRHSPLQGAGLFILKFDFNSVVVEKHSQSAHDGLNFRRVKINFTDLLHCLCELLRFLP